MDASHQFCVAPMMDWTDRHDRFFLRLITRHARLYTEMVTADAIRFGDRARLLDFDAAEHPLALQLGGSENWIDPQWQFHNKAEFVRHVFAVLIQPLFHCRDN